LGGWLFGAEAAVDEVVVHGDPATIASFKTWRIMDTDYRRPLATFAATISTVIALHFFAAS
jgi:hypothetical protein